MYCHCRCHVLSLRRIFEDISAEFEFVVCTELMLFREHLLLLQFYYVNNIPVTRYDDDQMRYIANIRFPDVSRLSEEFLRISCLHPAAALKTFAQHKEEATKVGRK